MISRPILLVVSFIAVSIAPLTAQPRGGPPGGGRPGGGGFRGGRPAILEVTGDKVAKLNPVAKLARERDRLGLTDRQSTRLDSVAAALEAEVAPFLIRIDSLKPNGRGGFRPRDPNRGDPLGAPFVDGPMAGLIDAVAQVELRYQASLQSVLKILTDIQQPKATKLVAKEVATMAEYRVRGPGRFGGQLEQGAISSRRSGKLSGRRGRLVGIFLPWRAPSPTPPSRRFGRSSSRS